MKIISINGIAAHNFTNVVIRQKKDIINLILECSTYLLINKNNDKIHYKVNNSSKLNNGDISIVIFIDKMSRLFFCSENKIQSFIFPFALNLNKPSKVMLSYCGHDITLDILSMMKSIFYKKEPDDLYAIYDELFNNEIYNSKSYDERVYLDKLLYNLIIFEDGYLRFDFHDEENERGDYHPLHHVDFFYSNKATFKIGLSGMLNISECIDVLDTNKKCYYISKMK